MEALNSEIAGLMKGYEVDVFGVGALSLYDKELVGLSETTKERYPSAISFGLVLSKGILETVAEGPNQLYLHHYRQLNYRLDMIAYFLSREIERRGFGSLPLAASQLVDWRNQKGHISHKKVGEIAGIGWLGRNNLLIHPEFGSRVRYNTVLTDMPLVPGSPLAEGCGECRACVDRCPAGAIKDLPSAFDHLGCFNLISKFRNERNIGHHICGICLEACKGKRE
jgi:epoxyqueuosine reductase